MRKCTSRKRKKKGSDDVSPIVRFNSLNNMLNVESSRNIKKGRWRVVPKDSCEVYKNRRKRQMKSDTETEETIGNGGSKDDPEKSQSSNTKRSDPKRVPRRLARRCKRFHRRREEESSTCSTFSSSLSTSTCCSCMDCN